MFVIKALCDYQPDASHTPIARSLAKYAVAHGYHKKVSASWGNGRPQPFSGAVGVALSHKIGVGSAYVSSGYRYNFTVRRTKESGAYDHAVHTADRGVMYSRSRPAS